MIIFYTACVLGLLSLMGGILVILRAGNKPENRVFLLIAVFSALWSISYASIELTNNLDTAVLLNKIAYFIGILLLVSATAFLYYYPKKIKLKSFFMFACLALPIALLSFTSLVSDTVTQNIDGTYNFQPGPLVGVYFASFMVGIALIVSNSIKTRRHVTGQAKSQLDFIMFGYGLSLILGISFSVVIPFIFPTSNLDDLAPASLTFMILLVAYAIARHKLFDFRAVLARSFAYLITTGLLVFIYVSSATLLIIILFPDQSLSNSQLTVNIFVTVLLVISFGKIKGIFDRVTNSIFFREIYDAQALLDNLNKTLVSNVDLEALLYKSAEIIQSNLRTTFCTFYIRQTSYFSDRTISTSTKENKIINIDDLQKVTLKLHTKTFSTEHEYKSESEVKTASILKRNGVEVMARLVNTLDYEVNGIGYLFLGPKKSGRPFVQKDLQILEIIANELVIAVENVLRFEEIEQFNVTLQKKIDDATKELKQTNDKLRALDEAKDEFVSMASHQLRTPLTSIKGYISMVLEGDAGKINETQEKMLGQAFFSSQRMVYLISDLLNVSRLKTGKFVIETKPVYLPDVVESEINQLIEGASTKNLTLSFAKPKTFATMNLDEMKLRQVIMNFTDNAIYYTPAGGKITVDLKETPKSVEFTVKDSGIGVPKEQQQKLFTKFYRADNARKARPDGTGLGLFMAKKVIIAQGGSIIFDSKEDKGSTFGFSFPKDRLEIKTESTTK